VLALDFDSPLTPFRALKKAEKFFEYKVNNTKVKQKPLTKTDEPLLEVGVTTIYGEIFWLKVHAGRNKEKTARLSIWGRMSTRQLFISAIAFLMSGPFFYMAFNSNNNVFVFMLAGFLAILGLFGLIMPSFRIRSIKKKFKESLLIEDDIEEEKAEESRAASMTRLE